MLADTYITMQLRECVRDAHAIAHNLPRLSAEINRIQQTIDLPMQVAVIGRVSSSKSTFVNALMGDEVVEMGKMVTTFNVCHLTYGDASSPIEVVFKDGRREFVPRNSLSAWAGNQTNDLKKDVLYLGLTYPNEILKNINIIDTPGLDSTMDVDSRNTINFLEKVRPDAIIMLFTKGAIAKETLDVVNQYIGSEQKQLNVSPLNAIGLYTKIDDIWKVSSAETNPRTLAEQTIKESIYGQFPEVHDSLYSIFPICARLGLAAYTVTNEDLNFLEKLSLTPEDTLRKMLLSDSLFTSSGYDEISHLSPEERTSLRDKFGKYGVFFLVSKMKEGNQTLETLRDLLDDISGMRLIRKRLLSHFGERAVLIKTQNIVTRIIKACNEDRKSHPDKTDIIDQIERNIHRTMSNIKEYKELDYLAQLYNGLANELDSEAVEEFKRVCGESENGNSVVKKLGLTNNTSIDQIRILINKRMANANHKANLKMLSSPKNAELYLMLVQSYQQLNNRIDNMLQKQEEAERTLRVAKEFFYGE
jgi:hypothetical protein